MTDISISQIMTMQKELCDLHKEEWRPLEPQYAKDSILWMIEEVGECIALIKKRGDNDIVHDEKIRQHFCEEMVDVLAYYSKVLLCLGISSEEISEAYLKKHEKNMHRDYKQEYIDKF